MQTTTEIKVRGYHVDHFGHVNHARYLEFLEEARWQYLEKNQLLEPIHRNGAFHVVSAVDIKYRHPLRPGDVLSIETKIDGRSRKWFRMDQRAYIKPSGKAAIEAVITNVFVDGQGRPRAIDSEMLRIWPDLSGAGVMGSGPDRLLPE